MNKKTVWKLATLLCFVSALNSHSQNLNVPGTTICQDPANGAYMRFGAGPSWQQDMTLRNTDVSGARMTFKTGVRGEIAGGFRDNSWGMELQLGVIENAVRTFKSDSSEFSGDGLELYQIPVMANVYYYLPFKGPVNGYVGAGIGGVVSSLRGEDFFDDNTYETTFGYQGSAGINWQITHRWALDAEYRFLGTTDHSFWSGFIKTGGTLNHSVLATVRYSF